MPEDTSVTGNPPAPALSGTAATPSTAGGIPGDAVKPAGPERGPGGKFLPRSETAKAEAGVESGASAAATPRPAGKKPKHFRVKQAPTAQQSARTAARTAKRETQQQAVMTARAITQLFISAATITFGPEAEPSDDLRKRIEEPQARILERMPELSEKIAVYADPLQLAIALTEWGVQLMRVAAEKKAERERESLEATGEPLKKEPPGAVDLPLDRKNGDQEPEEAPVTGELAGRMVPPAEIQSQMGKS